MDTLSGNITTGEGGLFVGEHYDGGRGEHYDGEHYDRGGGIILGGTLRRGRGDYSSGDITTGERGLFVGEHYDGGGGTLRRGTLRRGTLRRGTLRRGTLRRGRGDCSSEKTIRWRKLFVAKPNSRHSCPT